MNYKRKDRSNLSQESHILTCDISDLLSKYFFCEKLAKKLCNCKEGLNLNSLKFKIKNMKLIFVMIILISFLKPVQTIAKLSHLEKLGIRLYMDVLCFIEILLLLIKMNMKYYLMSLLRKQECYFINKLSTSGTKILEVFSFSS